MQPDQQPFKIGHIIIKVKDLHQVVKDYEALGFTITWGSNPQKAYNALIYLADGSFLELIRANLMNPVIQPVVLAVARLVLPFGKRAWSWHKRPMGFIGYAVDTTEEFTQTVTQTREQGIRIHKPMHATRTRPDNIKLSWFVALPNRVDLPFIMSPYDPHIPPSQTAITHGNGALGVKDMIIGSTNWEVASEAYTTFYQQTPETHTKNGRKTAIFRIGQTNLYLIESRVDGIQEIVLASNSAIPLDKSLLHNATIRLEKH